MKKTYGLIGYPLGHSFSARFFAEKFRAEGIDAEYLNFEMSSVADGLRTLIEQTPTLCGLNVTIPHKQAVIPLLDELSTEAREIGAVNVICIKKNGNGTTLRGCNSDVIGFADSIRPLLKPHHRRALILGTGGASKAIVYALRRMNITPLYVSRTPSEGRLTYEQISPEVLREHTIVVNCSPVGMHPHEDVAPTLPYECLTSNHLLYDLIYNPLETKFLRLGRERGAEIKNGLEMLHLQALAAWEFWRQFAY